jgi:translation initiation factor 1 (eIF-1/SUI1)
MNCSPNTRRDGARVTTRIKKVSGDHEAFLTELRAALQIAKFPGKDDSIRVRTGGAIEIKGNRVQEVKTWLAALGF